MNKYLCFRFDIDTHICLKKGVPELIRVFEKHNAHGTFFISMGKAFKRSYALSEKFNNDRKNTTSIIGKFSMFYKLGLYDSFVAFVLNPTIGAKYKTVLKMLVDKGHELGLHGGRNHATWERDAGSWSESKLEEEILFGINEFKNQDLPFPISFASPCWNAPENLNKILGKSGFKIVANQVVNINYVPETFNINEFPTNVIGKNKQVGFIENLRALGYSTEEILEEFANQLNDEAPFKMVFDHPFYVGIHELKTVEAMIIMGMEKGYIIDSLKNSYKHLKNENTSHLS